YWTAGNDILFGRDGDDTYFAGDGELPEGVSERGAIIFVGGEGDEDKVDYSSLTGRIKVSYDKSFFGGIDTSNARLSANPGQRIRLRPDEWKS
ncbi:hypothetical protein ACIAN7_19405, partial [Acinetobacter baumannii]|uniref:hypothetical protein n=1 Tax=Acinetobacter baumannii TaxID=470 RepID=UPI00379559D5